MCADRRQHGLTLIELIMFIVIVGVALAGVLTVLNYTTRHSADPLVRKQALAIAEAILEEVMLQPFTWCDPDDAAAAAATSAVGCVAEVLGVETVGGNTDTRPSNTSPFDNVSDYHGLTNTTINIAGASMPAGYNASVVVENTSDAAANRLGGVIGITSITTDAAVLLISVTVTAPGETIQLQGYRTRYSPNTLP
ncbi:MAG: type II secretion system protein [Rhodocyclaceae bacterium]|nr:type II secretion system protein [Rhodocyclaceae bacterium]